MTSATEGTPFIMSLAVPAFLAWRPIIQGGVTASRLIAVAVFALALVACAITVSSNLVFAGQLVPGPAGPG